MTSSSPPSFLVAGVKIDAVCVDDVVDAVARWIATGRRDYVVLTGAHGVVEMQTDAELRAINNRAGITTPDGMPVVWIGRARGHARTEKTYAPDVMNACFAAGLAPGHRHFLYGGKEGVAETLRSVLRAKYPGIRVVGTHTPPFRPLTADEEGALTKEIDDSGADIVWCGLGCPKQERWMARFRPRLAAPVLIGVGAGFDFLAGTMPLAPRWVQRSGFEWLYRLASDPKRLWPRYSRVVPKFMYFAAKDEILRRIGERPLR